MKIILTGSHGFLGTAFSQFLAVKGITTIPLLRHENGQREEGIVWRPGVDPKCLDGADAVVHLAGARIDRRWTPAVRREIESSRVDFTRALCGALAAVPHPPARLLCASAIGYYGDRGEETLDEQSSQGAGFLADLTAAWEAAAEPARRAGIRIVHLRLGVVLGRERGALARLLPLFRLGLGGPVGGGRQYMSWIHRDDAIGAMLHLLELPNAAGPYNLTAPQPATNKEFARALGRALRRPAVLPVPGFALRAVFGEMASETLLASARALPQRLMDSGFAFRFPDLDAALRNLVGA